MYTQWIEDCVVQRVSVRDGLVLDLDDYNEVVISRPLLLTLPAADRFPAEAVPHQSLADLGLRAPAAEPGRRSVHPGLVG